MISSLIFGAIAFCAIWYSAYRAWLAEHKMVLSLEKLLHETSVGAMITIPLAGNPAVNVIIPSGVPMADQVLIVEAAQALAKVGEEYREIVLGLFMRTKHENVNMDGGMCTCGTHIAETAAPMYGRK